MEDRVVSTIFQPLLLHFPDVIRVITTQIESTCRLVNTYLHYCAADSHIGSYIPYQPVYHASLMSYVTYIICTSFMFNVDVHDIA